MILLPALGLCPASAVVPPSLDQTFWSHICNVILFVWNQMQHPRVAIVDYIISVDLYTVFVNLLRVVTSILLDLALLCC